MSTAIAIVHKQEILEQIAKGKLLKEVAAMFGVSKQAIWEPLKDDPDYRQAITLQCAALIEEAKQLTWAAREGLDIARAREISKWAFRYAESMDKGTWGQHGNSININANGPVSIAVVSYDAVQEVPAIEHDPGSEDS
jgi:hypothetical protein